MLRSLPPVTSIFRHQHPVAACLGLGLLLFAATAFAHSEKAHHHAPAESASPTNIPADSSSISAPPAASILAHSTIEAIAFGTEKYQQLCSQCHETGIGPSHGNDGHTWHHADAILFDYIKIGGNGVLTKQGQTNTKSGMPAFGDRLEDDQIWAILAYIRSQWGSRQQATQQAIDARFRETEPNYHHHH